MKKTGRTSGRVAGLREAAKFLDDHAKGYEASSAYTEREREHLVSTLREKAAGLRGLAQGAVVAVATLRPTHDNVDGLKTTRLLTESEISTLAQDSDILAASVSEALTEQLLHTLVYWKMQCEMAVKEIGDLRSLTIAEAPNASFVVSYREVLAERKKLRAVLTSIGNHGQGAECPSYFDERNDCRRVAEMARNALARRAAEEKSDV